MMNEKPTLLYVSADSVILKLFELNFRKKFNVLTADVLNERLIHKYFRKPFNMKEIEASIFEILS